MKLVCSQYLESRHYETIAGRMLRGGKPSGETAACRITKVMRKMRGLDCSLSAQLGAILYQPSAVHESTADEAPDAFLVTACSAIPLADAIRGFFEAAGDEIPVIGSIHANRTAAAGFLSPELRTYSQVAGFKKETERLRHILPADARQVCVIDQYVSSGNTLRYAGLLLEAAGVETVTAIRGHWYHQVEARDIDCEALTSSHADMMREVGSAAFAEL